MIDSQCVITEENVHENIQNVVNQWKTLVKFSVAKKSEPSQATEADESTVVTSVNDEEDCVGAEAQTTRLGEMILIRFYVHKMFAVSKSI